MQAVAWTERPLGQMRKLRSTIRILFCLGMARTFGQYVHSAWDGRMHYAVYRWRGEAWAIPTSPMEGG